MKRTLPALKLQNSPLVLVLLQVRIAPVMKMGDYIPDIQERLRRSGLPRFAAGEDIQLQMAQTAVVNRTPRWEFQSRDQTRSVVITQDFITAQTTAYNVYKDFEEFFSNPLQVVGEIVEPSLVQRLGLRYVDLIRPGPESDIEDFLKPGLQGLKADDIGANNLLSRFEMLAQTEVGMMRIRCLQSNDGSPLPSDLRTNTLNLDATVANGLEVGETVAILDLDHFVSEPMDYEHTSVVDSISDLHDNLDLAFRAAVTEDAMTAWGKEELRA